MKKFGLLGKTLGHSFSQNYFSNKFKKEGLEKSYTYNNYPIESIDLLKELLLKNPDIIGLNVTIPYKISVLPFIDILSKNAQEIGAVNTIKILPNGKLFGDNSDYFGFIESLKPLLKSFHQKALILGTGGSSKAVAYGLSTLNIETKFVSREKLEFGFTYEQLNQDIIQKHPIIINCTPLGTFPKIDEFPDIPYQYLTSNHIVYDLIYNPEETSFLKRAKSYGATIKNGYEMLELQAEKSWEIWNQPN